MKPRTSLVFGTLALAALGGAGASAQQIGTVELVRAAAFGTPPAARRVRLESRAGVVSNEFVETERDSALGIRFRDDTVFRLGPDSRAVLDRFVYDPGANSGQLALTLGRGTFRYISGNMPKNGVRIVTPQAVIGIRGTDFVVQVRSASASGGAETAIAACTDGVVVGGSAGGAPVLLAAGQSAVVNAAGQVSVGSGVACQPTQFIGAFGGGNNLPGSDNGANAGEVVGGPCLASCITPPVLVLPPPLPPPVPPPVYNISITP